MKALIVGGAGFVGKYLIDAIKQDLNCDVIVTKSEHHNAFRDDVQFVNLNVLNKEETLKVLKHYQPNYIFHLAAQSSISRSWKDPINTVRVNIMGSLVLLDAVKEAKLNPVIIMVGSGEEYGLTCLQSVPLKEIDILSPQNIYAATKACQNMLSSVYSKAYGMSIIMVRAFNHVGPGQSDIFVISDFCHQVAKIESGLQEPVIKVGNLNAKRDFTDVRDVVRAYTSLAQFGVFGETYNVGSGSSICIRDVLDLILSKSKTKIRIEEDKQKFRPVDVPIIEADISKISNTTGWKPNIGINTIIEDMLDYWRLNV